MRRHLKTLIIVAATALVPASGSAAPILLDSTAWSAAVAGLTVVTEDFSGFAPGGYGASFAIANGEFSTDTGTAQIQATTLFCASGEGECLLTNELVDQRTFSNFAPGTNLWSVGTFNMRDPTDIIRVTVVGASGTSVFEESGHTFWGFSDPLGLTSVTFLNLGFNSSWEQYSFDNVATASARVRLVPEPTSMLLLGAGMASLAARRRRSAVARGGR